MQRSLVKSFAPLHKLLSTADRILSGWAVSLLVVCLTHHFFSQWAWLEVTWFWHPFSWITVLLGVEQNKHQFFRFAVTSDLRSLPDTNWGPRAECGHGCRRDRHTLGFRGAVSGPEQSPLESGAFPLHLSFHLVIYFCSNVSCPNEGASFNPGPSPGLPIRRGRFCNSSEFSVQKYLPYERKSSVRI